MIRVLLLIFVFGFAATAEAEVGDALRRGDMLSLQMPGEPAFEKPFQIDARGQVLLPEIGFLSVVGMARSDAFNLIRARLGEKFKNLDGLSVALKERRLLVTVLGYVKQPGIQNLDEIATIQMAITHAGGLRAGAQLNKIQIRRGERVIVFNYKQYLDSGDSSLIPSLRSMDQIFVPASPLTGNVEVDFDAKTLTSSGDAADEDTAVIVFGEVHRPGSFAFKDSYSIVDLIMRAGGVTRYAAVDKIRILSGGAPAPFNLRAYLDTGRRDLMPALAPGDTIYVPQIVDQVQGGERTIHIIGAVNKPGRFDYSEGMSLLDLIAVSGGPKAEADTAHVQVLKTGEGGVVKAIPFNLKKFLDDGGHLSSMPTLAPGDTVLVAELPKDPNDNRSQWVRQSSGSSIYVFGGVGAPGRYGFNEELNFLDILSAAQGPTNDADLRNVRITHRNQGRAQVSHVDLSQYFRTGDETLLPKVAPEDVIFLPRRKGDWRDLPQEHSIRVLGAIDKPGRYVFDDTMSILDLLAEAGGPTKIALQDKIIIISNSGGERESRTFDLVAFAQTGDFTKLPVLRAGDTVYLPNKEEGAWNIASEAFRDAVSVLSLVRLISGL